ncbi:hypothetical protein LX36DRAFT_661685 [Colletotrichum falcatum]|nr:hypothetical protein LX36DRAFT_661685 [Colletotrichum falcatum]
MHFKTSAALLATTPIAAASAGCQEYTFVNGRTCTKQYQTTCIPATTRFASVLLRTTSSLDICI